MWSHRCPRLTPITALFAFMSWIGWNQPHAEELGEGGEPVRRHARGGGGEAEAHEPSERSQAAVALAERAGGVEHDVDAAPAGDAAHLGLEVLRPVVDGVRHTGVAQHGVLARRRRADHLGAREPAELDRGHADAAGRGVYQHALAGLHVAEVGAASARP